MGILDWLRGKPPDLNSLLAQLRSGPPQQRAEAVEAIGNLGPSILPDLLLTLFLSKDEEAVWVARAFRRMGTPGLRFLREALKHPGYDSRRSAANALKEFGADAAGAVSELALTLEDVDPEVRWKSAVALGCIGPAARPALAALEKASREKRDPKLVSAAGEAIRAIRGDPPK